MSERAWPSRQFVRLTGRGDGRPRSLAVRRPGGRRHYRRGRGGLRRGLRTALVAAGLARALADHLPARLRALGGNGWCTALAGTDCALKATTPRPWPGVECCRRAGSAHLGHRRGHHPAPQAAEERTVLTAGLLLSSDAASRRRSIARRGAPSPRPRSPRRPRAFRPARRHVVVAPRPSRPRGRDRRAP